MKDSFLQDIVHLTVHQCAEICIQGFSCSEICYETSAVYAVLEQSILTTVLTTPVMSTKVCCLMPLNLTFNTEQQLYLQKYWLGPCTHDQ